MGGQLVQLITDEELDLAPSQPELANLVAQLLGDTDGHLAAAAQHESEAIAGFVAGAAAVAELAGSLVLVIAAASEVVQTPLEAETEQLRANIASGRAILGELAALDPQPPATEPPGGGGTGGGGGVGGPGGGGGGGGGRGGGECIITVCPVRRE